MSDVTLDHLRHCAIPDRFHGFKALFTESALPPLLDLGPQFAVDPLRAERRLCGSLNQFYRAT